MFGGYLLKNVAGLHHINYANKIYRGKKTGQIIFKEKGFIYGPIRLSADPMSQVYEKLIKPTCDIDFVEDKIAIFLVRDPRDILVSSFYSFGYSHGFSNVEEIKQRQIERRINTQSVSLDKYALQSAPGMLSHFTTMCNLSRNCNRGVVLRYEDMIENWEDFAAGLCKYINIKPRVLEQVYQRSRPRQREDITSHRRSGKSGGFRSKLSEETIASLNLTFEPVLEYFKYDL